MKKLQHLKEIRVQDILLERLEILWHKLENEGHYVKANTVGLAIDEIVKLHTQVKELTNAHQTAN